MYGRRFSTMPVERPVFVTSLPRAGTTLVLEVLGRLPTFATYSYRDMPFVLAPLLWEQLSKGFRKPAHLAERAHGDGMAVSYDSPEAFEEVLWLAAWPDKFSADQIALWSADEEATEFRDQLHGQMQRIIAARSGDGAPRRYLSKNNANIARLGLLRRLFPDAILLVPYRSPLDQAGSLLRQHLRFLEIHQQDPFARRYMEDIGHLEFGALHRPLAFDEMAAIRARFPPSSMEYWLGYWIAAFRHILRHRADILLVSYGELCAAGFDGVRTLARHLDVPAEVLESSGSIDLHEPRNHRSINIDRDLLSEANAVHHELMTHSLRLGQAQPT